MSEKVKMKATILSQEKLAEGVYSMWIQAEEVAKVAKPGQFIAVYSDDKSRMLPRPISLCEIKEDRIRIVYRVVGSGTEEFAAKEAGDSIEIMGPLGNGFTKESGRIVVIGGGIGVPPMLGLAQSFETKVTAVLGYRHDQFLREAFEQVATVYVATEDGSDGTKGNVLDAMRAEQIEADVIYACGPTPMLRAIKAYAEEKHIRCYLSLEEKMACGIGACLACVCQSKEKDEHSQVTNKRICKEGPVFLAEEVTL
ncbi:MAG: dihydroorotate dehydrogenase electron transfer subunit [Lachnospiraceae bacterium]|jgi:dihydroorotate dehydrogenase electron transfer subunit|nr:dihydroorotate dehydrogenase electron transfer subunit [Lachnospiraceae bacterium]